MPALVVVGLPPRRKHSRMEPVKDMAWRTFDRVLALHRKTNSMINLRMVMGEGADERDCGEQGFAHMPRADDIVVGYVDGRMMRLRVSELYHYPTSARHAGHNFYCIRMSAPHQASARNPGKRANWRVRARAQSISNPNPRARAQQIPNSSATRPTTA